MIKYGETKTGDILMKKSTRNAFRFWGVCVGIIMVIIVALAILVSQ